MRITKKLLKQIISEREIVGDVPAYATNDFNHVLAYHKDIKKYLESLKIMQVEAIYERGHFDPQYTHLFLSKKDKGHIIQKNGKIWTVGISLYLSHLIPAAIYGKSTITEGDEDIYSVSGERVTRHYVKADYLYLGNTYKLPDGDWKIEKTTLVNCLQHFGISLHRRKTLKNIIPAEINSQL